MVWKKGHWNHFSVDILCPSLFIVFIELGLTSGKMNVSSRTLIVDDVHSRVVEILSVHLGGERNAVALSYLSDSIYKLPALSSLQSCTLL